MDTINYWGNENDNHSEIVLQISEWIKFLKLTFKY